MFVNYERVKLSFWEWVKMRLFGKTITSVDIRDGKKITVTAKYLNNRVYIHRMEEENEHV